MLLRPEAPRRPFSAVRSPTTGALLSSPTDPDTPLLIDPRILFVLAQPLDIGYVAPTVQSLLSAEKREGCEVFVVSVSDGEGDERGGKEGMWEKVGVDGERRVVLDVP